MTGKQKIFADTLLKDPKATLKQAAKEAYGVEGNVAEVMGYENIRKPQIMQYLALHANKAENTLVEVMEYSKNSGRENPSYASVAVSAAKDILDRVHGKATQKVESTTSVVTLNLSLADLTTNSNQ